MYTPSTLLSFFSSSHPSTTSRTDYPTDRAQSTLTNKSRLKLLQQREEHLQDLFSTARASIEALAADEGRYAQFLEGVIVQGYLNLLEPEVTVHARGKDTAVVERAASAAAEQYAQISGRTVAPTVVGSLSDDMCVLSLCGRDRSELGIDGGCGVTALVESSSSAALGASHLTIRWMNGYVCLRTGCVSYNCV